MKILSLNRRDYLRVTGASVGVGLLGTSATTCPAIEPIKRTGDPSFQFSLAAYSYRSLLQGKPPKLTLFDFIDDCASLGLQGTELTSYYFEEPVTDGYLRRLKQHCFRQGVDISGTAIRCDFGVAPGKQRDKEIADVKTWIEKAEILGAPVIRIFAGHKPKLQSEKRTHELIVDGINECCEHAGDHGIHLALENHGGPSSTASGLLAIVKEVDSDWFGVNLDTGNFHSDDPYSELEQAAPYAVNVQVKVVMSGPDKKKHPADFGRIAKILRDANYRGYVVLEYEEAGDPRVECAAYVKKLRKAFQ